MKKLRSNIDLVLEFIKGNPLLSSKEIYDGINGELGYATVKRILQKLIADGFITHTGQGRATRYTLSPGYSLLYLVSIDDYFAKEVDERSINPGFNFSLIPNLLAKVPLFTEGESTRLYGLQEIFAIIVPGLQTLNIKESLSAWRSTLAGSLHR